MRVLRAALLTLVAMIASLLLGYRYAPLTRPFSQSPTVTGLTQPIHQVGYTTLHFTYPLPDRTAKQLTVAVWYPTQAPPKPFDYQRKLAPAGLVAVDAPVDGGSGAGYPLIVFSHGAFGCATIYSFLTERLASQGYVVAAPDHSDALVCSIDGGRGPGNLQHPDQRPLDMSATISELFRQNEAPSSGFYQAINESEVGVAGHSAGGLTAMQLAGADPSNKDARVKAALMLAEDTGPLPIADFANMTVPVLFEVGQFDPVDLHNVARRTPYDAAPPPKFLAIVRRANHLAFDDTDCDDSPSLQDCVNTHSHVAVEVKYAVTFFNFTLRGDQMALTVLTSPDNRLAKLEYVLR